VIEHAVLWGALALMLQSSGTQQPLELALPGKDWALTGTIPGLQVSTPRQTSAGVTMRGTDIERGMVVHVALYPAPERGDTRHCRDRLWKRERPAEVRHVDKGESGPWAFVEFDTPDGSGTPIKRELLACRVHDGVWIQLQWSLPTVVDPAPGALRAPLALLTIGPVERGSATR